MTGVYLVPLLADSSIPFFSALWDAALLSFARLPPYAVGNGGGVRVALCVPGCFIPFLYCRGPCCFWPLLPPSP